jgi:hypothetical protein
MPSSEAIVSLASNGRKLRVNRIRWEKDDFFLVKIQGAVAKWGNQNERHYWSTTVQRSHKALEMKITVNTVKENARICPGKKWRKMDTGNLASTRKPHRQIPIQPKENAKKGGG